MTDFIAVFERDLVAAAGRRRASLRVLLLATVLFVLIGAVAAGGTLLVLRGSVIPAPAERDVPADQLPVPGTARLAPVRSADPDPGQPAWALRVSRSRTGLLCSAVGQVVGGRFGLVGMDGRFRGMPERIVDGCSEIRDNAASLIGARVLDARRPADVRTILNGVAGPTLRRVQVTVAGRAREVPIAEGGAFLAALRGYPEDAGVQVTLTFADGHAEHHPLGASSWVVRDPAGRRAWKPQSMGFGSAPGKPGNPATCVSFQPARELRNPPISPLACGVFRDMRRRTGYFFAVRRITPGTGGIPVMPAGRWGRHPARTAVWGAAGEDVRGVEVAGPNGLRQAAAISPSRAFLAIFDPRVRPEDLEVRIAFTDGRVERRRGSAHLVRPPRLGP